MKHFVAIVIAIIFAQLFLTACTQGQKNQPSGSVPSEVPVINVIPTPSTGNSTITGIFKRKSGNGSEPAASIILSLGVMLQNDQGTPTVAQLDTNTKLRTITDKNGRFVFENVPPGKYVLVFDRIIDSYMMNDPNTGGDFIITAAPDQIVDLGELVYDKTPE